MRAAKDMRKGVLIISVCVNFLYSFCWKCFLRQSVGLWCAQKRVYVVIQLPTVVLFKENENVSIHFVKHPPYPPRGFRYCLPKIALALCKSLGQLVRIHIAFLCVRVPERMNFDREYSTSFTVHYFEFSFHRSRVTQWIMYPVRPNTIVPIYVSTPSVPIRQSQFMSLRPLQSPIKTDKVSRVIVSERFTCSSPA
jgi:hypothetical protein